MPAGARTALHVIHASAAPSFEQDAMRNRNLTALLALVGLLAFVASFAVALAR